MHEELGIALRHWQIDVVRHVLQRVGSVSGRRLKRLLFLIDRELCRRFGDTAFSWKLYKYGPTSREMFHTLDDLEYYGSIVSRATDDDIIYENASTAPIELPQEVREVVDEVLETWGGRSFEELAEYVNSLEEVAKTPPGRKLLC
jgi:hypothetical protein